jgi:hypothetical protein
MIEPSKGRGASALAHGALAGVVAAAILFVVGGARAADRATASAEQRVTVFVEKWRCPVAAYLQGIHQRPQTNSDRYLVLWAKRRPAFYVQCIFHDDDRQIYCEAASGFYERADRVGSFATPARLDALSSLGFATDGAKGNWAQERDFHSADEIATLMLESLARVFETNADDALLYSAPLLSKRRSNRVKAGAECAPVSLVAPADAHG